MVSKAIRASILSLLITGVGQIYLKKFARGLIWLVGGFGVGIIIGIILPQFYFIGFIIPILSSIDAYMLGKKKV